MTVRIVHIIPLIFLASCADDLSKINQSYNSFITDKMASESEAEVDEAFSVLQQTIDDTVFTFRYIDKLLDAISCSDDGFEKASGDVQNESVVIDLEKCLLNSLHECSNHNNKYSIDLDSYDLSNSNPRDSSWLAKIHREFDYLKNSQINSSTKMALLKSIQLSYYEKLEGKFNPPCCFCFWQHEPFIYSKQHVWHQNEPAWITVSEASFDLNVVTKYRINRKAYTGQTTLYAPTQKGVHEIKGEIGVKEKGEINWVPFSYRILVE